ncbi:hypothetical protein [Undibacter mobilis]|uniref:hypothetical protein n=1 Tax=Undibacter mobilis TaxID=2292256 RepID=UPI0011C076E4|nr:hypothetical protein [Undibacter mobilis]
MVRRDVKSKLAMAGTALVALALGGCGSVNSMSDTLRSDAGWFSKPVSGLFSREDGSGSMGTAKNLSLGPSGPVPPEDLVNPDGSCAAAAAETPAPASPAAPQAGSVAGDLAGSPMPAGGDAPVLGGVALGMSECQVVRRAGTPSNVAISAAENNERKTVLTYAAGQWPGVYTFASGRLKVVDALPQAQKPKPVAKKKPAPKRAPTRIN